MSNLSLSDMSALALAAGFPDPALAAAIAMAESGGNPAAVGDTQPGVLGPSIGLWQIDLYFHPQYTQAELVDPAANARAAYAIWLAAGKKFTPWSTYNAGLYKRWYVTPFLPPRALKVLGLVFAGSAWMLWRYAGDK